MKTLGKVEKEGICEQATRLEEEARMVLPGVQATFGFQLIAVFNQGFSALTSLERLLHLGALLLTALAAIQILTPAAYHRQVEVDQVSEFFVRLASRLLCLAMGAFAVGLALDCYLISRVVTQSITASLVIAFGLLTIELLAWYGYPAYRRRIR